ncbi:MAG: D-alanine--D-alanine ligase [candidate division Zixibacteria bacterium]|nr:D-alanine--D-alanine ligase [candidate division Zixibacteria bacterium]
MNILLLGGGNSSENQVSLNSSKAMYESLVRLGHSVLAIDPSSGRLLIGTDGQFNAQLPHDQPNKPVADPQRSLTAALGSPEMGKVDLVVLGLHGGAGENGTIQALLDLAGIKYTGSGMAASAIAMNKAVTKRLFESDAIPTPAWLLIKYTGEACEARAAAEIAHRFTFPVIIKPNDGGSTVGLTKVKAASEIPAALRAAAAEGDRILVEEFIQGRELTVAVLDGEALPVVEIRPKNELYDYQAKYTKGMSEYIAPAEIDSSLAVEIQRSAVKAYEVVTATGLARVDFMLAPDGRFYCLEVNTLPGMTNLSLAPMAAKCVGMDFDALMARIIKSALG